LCKKQKRRCGKEASTDTPPQLAHYLPTHAKSDTEDTSIRAMHKTAVQTGQACSPVPRTVAQVAGQKWVQDPQHTAAHARIQGFELASWPQAAAR